MREHIMVDTIQHLELFDLAFIFEKIDVALKIIVEGGVDICGELWVERWTFMGVHYLQRWQHSIIIGLVAIVFAAIDYE